MNQVVIFFVPTQATQQDFEAALREHSASLQISKHAPQAKTEAAEIPDNDQLPFWTWFVPNSRP
jgi:hypothetical protein